MKERIERVAREMRWWEWALVAAVALPLYLRYFFKIIVGCMPLGQ